MALMARYSRSNHPSIIDALDKEFTKESYTPEMLERVINQYGDASVLELSNIQMAIEGISNIAINDIEKSRIGISFLEKSSRYIDYTKGFSYHTPEAIKYHESLFREYEYLMGLSRDYYTTTINTLTDHVFNQYPIESLTFHDSKTNEETRYDNLSLAEDKETARKIHRKSIKEYVMDNARSFLPSSLITNVAFNTNFRSLRELLARLHASKIEESQQTYSNLMDILKPYHLLLKRVSNLSLPTYRQKNNDLFDLYNSHCRNSIISIYKNYIQDYINEFEDEKPRPKVYTKPDVRLVYMLDKTISEAMTSAAIISEFDDVGTKNIHFGDIVDYFLDEDNNTTAQKEYLIQNYVKNRQSKFDKAGIAFEFLDYIFEIQSSFGTFRDLRRHRTLTRVYDKVITTRRGYLTPREFHFSDRVVKNYVDLQTKYNSLYDKILEKTNDYYTAQYCTNFGNIIKYTFKTNLRELTTLCELRTGINAHFEYKSICLDMFRLLSQNNSELLIKNAMKFVNQDQNTKLGRIEENKKISKQGILT